MAPLRKSFTINVRKSFFELIDKLLKAQKIPRSTKYPTCCVLECALPFDAIIVKKNIEDTDFTHTSTNWNGCDSIPRTLWCLGMKETGRKFKLKHEIIFAGTDGDMGHHYHWTFPVDEIRELEPV